MRPLLLNLMLASAAVPALLVVPVGAAAQESSDTTIAAAQEALADARRRLAENPRNVPALIAAGNALIDMDEHEEALSFFNRAQAERPSDPRVLTGLALIAVERGDAVTAIQLFDNANLQGGSLAEHAAERGLAYDLVGNNGRAQRLYRQALSREEDDEVIRRLALSYAISGDADASETTLLPLLQRQDRRAFRTRAFALAIIGRDEEAMAIAEAMLPARLTQRLAPFLQYMPRLTPAQQAAAANLGRFPDVAEIGQDSAAVLAMAEPQAQPSGAPTANDRLTPSGEPLGPAQPAVVAEAAPVTPSPQPDQTGESPALASASTEPSRELPAVATTELPAREIPPPPAREPSPVVAATMDPEDEVEAAIAAAGVPQAQAAQEPRPSFSITEPVAEPAVVAQAEEQSGEQLELAEAFADFRLPPGGIAVAPSAGAVDITRIEPARPALPPAAEPEPEPAPPAHPSRHWVQVATGQDVNAFRFDWRRIVRNSNGLLDGREAYTAPWNGTNRLVTGPFESRTEANRFVTQLEEAGVDAFRFTSAEGEEVTPIN